MGRIVVDKDICKGCYLCMKACPKGLLKKSNESTVNGFFPVEFADENHECTGCGLCALNCPDVAICEVYR